jgi:hypothetical protein
LLYGAPALSTLPASTTKHTRARLGGLSRDAMLLVTPTTREALSVQNSTTALAREAIQSPPKELCLARPLPLSAVYFYIDYQMQNACRV